MKIKAKENITINNVVVPKGTDGTSAGVSNSQVIKKEFMQVNGLADGWFYIVLFPSCLPDAFLCNKNQLEII